ncbi:ABC transporter ATP-binding protein [Streptomyces acidiscabies]|uniref:ABC transporter ATP-binding protein n=1 Tax=Streptomyces acidiscabies TaxID=42234 RepID=UPI00095E2C34|nr:ATP-binding cassette domain-containing protein [Streptomyces acidiscabies]GAV44887.1 glutathione import ATP-binding protein GsiA [Streptomyces acidiscabies]
MPKRAAEPPRVPAGDGAAEPAPSERVVAELRDLRVEIGGRAIVDGVSLRVTAGRVTALVGASGSGKTTTGLALLGEFPSGAAVTGEVRAADRVGYVPQHPAAVLNPARRVSALLTDIARTRPRTERRGLLAGALADAQVPEPLLRRFPHQLSGGQQQRVTLAQALLLGAQVVVADEPTTGQDALTKSRVVDELSALAAHGIAVVLLSHDLDVVRALADEVHVMRAGRVVESGPVDRLRLTPQHPWTRELFDAARPFTSPDTTPGEEILGIENLTARHRRTSVVHIPRLTLHQGECLAMVGRSGSGKTTLARALAGLHRAYDGEVTLDGTPLPRSLRDRTRAQLAAVQYVFQDARSAFDEHRTILDQVSRTAIRLRGLTAPTAQDEARDTLTSLGLTEPLWARLPAALSGGELQRASLARALLARPRVLLCDEITSALDPVTRRTILDTLTALLHTRPDLTLVLITHDLDTATLAHRIAVLDAGELVETGPAEEILTRPTHPFTAALTRTTARLQGT